MNGQSQIDLTQIDQINRALERIEAITFLVAGYGASDTAQSKHLSGVLSNSMDLIQEEVWEVRRAVEPDSGQTTRHPPDANQK